MSRIPETFTCTDIPENCLFGTDIVGSPVLKLNIVGQLDNQKIIFGADEVDISGTKIYLGSFQFCYPVSVSIYNRPYINVNGVNLETYAGFKARSHSVEARLIEFSHKQSRSAVTDSIKAVWGIYYCGFDALFSSFVLEPDVFISSVSTLCTNVLRKCKENKNINVLDLMYEVVLKEVNERNNPNVFKQMKRKYFVD